MKWRVIETMIETAIIEVEAETADAAIEIVAGMDTPEYDIEEVTRTAERVQS